MNDEVTAKEAATVPFGELTDKQLETLDLLADGLTSKEIARKLGISVSAVVQRVEALRAKSGGAMRKDLVRRYRLYRKNKEATCNQDTCIPVHLPPYAKSPEDPLWNFSGAEQVMADAMTFDKPSPWASRSEPRVVPEVLEGRDASLNRWLVAILAALAMSGLMLILITMSGELSELF